MCPYSSCSPDSSKLDVCEVRTHAWRAFCWFWRYSPFTFHWWVVVLFGTTICWSLKTDLQALYPTFPRCFRRTCGGRHLFQNRSLDTIGRSCWWTWPSAGHCSTSIIDCTTFNLFWHGLAILLLMMLLERLLQDKLSSTIGAAVFALHPVQIEVVGFISARNDPMAVSWLLVALLLLSRKTSTVGFVGRAVGFGCGDLVQGERCFCTVVVGFACRARWGGWETKGHTCPCFLALGSHLACVQLREWGFPPRLIGRTCLPLEVRLSPFI